MQLRVMQLEGVRFKKYVLQNEWTGIIVDRRFWTVRGALRQANKNIKRLTKTINRLDTRKV